MKTYQISVGGETFPIKSDADEAHVEALAREIRERFEAIHQKNRGAKSPAQTFRAMTMVAITLLDELEELRGRHGRMQQDTAAFAEQISARIDAILSGTP